VWIISKDYADGTKNVNRNGVTRMAMHISNNGLNIIKHFEGCRLTAYLCPAGVPTIGYGHTAGVKLGMKITQAQADEYLKQDMKIYEDHVNRIVKHKLTQNQFDALVSFCYNCGAGNLQKLVKNRTLQQIADTLPLYNKGGGKVLAGLVRRRKMERELFLKDMPKPNTQKYMVTAWGLNVRAGIGTKYKIVRVLKKDQVVEVTETSNGWGRISDGWISLTYVKRI
jgi:GH24 family phage-related lysozyme (muramidase)